MSTSTVKNEVQASLHSSNEVKQILCSTELKESEKRKRTEYTEHSRYVHVHCMNIQDFSRRSPELRQTADA